MMCDGGSHPISVRNYRNVVNLIKRRCVRVNKQNNIIHTKYIENPIQLVNFWTILEEPKRERKSKKMQPTKCPNGCVHAGVRIKLNIKNQ